MAGSGARDGGGRPVDVSVVVPCYNTERFLDQALTSAAQNARCSLEIVVLNDGSTDGSLRIMQAHAARDARVRVIDKPNAGYGATVNRGIAEARGTYVAILEPDDYVVAGAYDELFALARRTGLPDVVKSAYWRVGGEGGRDAWRAYGYLHGRVRRVGERITLAQEPQLIQYHPAVWSALYAREFLERERIRMVEAPGAGWVDNPFCVETLAAARSIVYTDEAYYCYREDLAGASSAHVEAPLMVARWMERQDALDARGIRDAGVLRANYVAGLRFIARMLAVEERLGEDARAGMRAMARRMDPVLVSGIDCISPQVVRRVLELAGSELAAPGEAAYAAHLAREAAWALTNNGVGFLVHNLRLAHDR